MTVDGVDTNLRESIAAEIETKVAIALFDIECRNGHRRAKRLALVCGLAHLDGARRSGALIEPEHVHGMVGPDHDKRTLDVADAFIRDQASLIGSPRCPAIGRSCETDSVRYAAPRRQEWEVPPGQIHIALA